VFWAIVERLDKAGRVGGGSSQSALPPTAGEAMSASGMTTIPAMCSEIHVGGVRPEARQNVAYVAGCLRVQAAHYVCEGGHREVTPVVGDVGEEGSGGDHHTLRHGRGELSATDVLSRTQQLLCHAASASLRLAQEPARGPRPPRG
jgi:hypothetical protein